MPKQVPLVQKKLMTNHQLVVAVVFLFFASGCSLLDGNSDMPAGVLTQDPELLVGTWEWQSSTYYFTVDGEPNKKTPESAGYTETLKFYAGGIVERYRNGELEEREPYEIKKQKYPNGTESEDPMLFMGGRGAAAFGVNREKLRISTAFRDGPESIYRRQN